MTIFRRGAPGDLGAVAAIQQASPEMPQWPVGDYLAYDLLVAERDGRVCGFLSARTVADGENELLNLAVAPEDRRRGIARGLIHELFVLRRGSIFLEVRESNHAARSLYQSMGFREIHIRPKYYDKPRESGIVMTHYRSRQVA